MPVVKALLAAGCAFFLGWCITAAASAQIYECDGRWTNKPCDGTVNRSMEEVSRPDRPAPSTAPPNEPAPEPLAPRYSLIRKLKKLNDEYVNRGVPGLNDSEIDGFESLCLDRGNPFTDCQGAFNDYSTRLRELELAREANDLAAERNTIEHQKIEPGRRR